MADPVAILEAPRPGRLAKVKSYRCRASSTERRATAVFHNQIEQAGCHAAHASRAGPAGSEKGSFGRAGNLLR